MSAFVSYSFFTWVNVIIQFVHLSPLTKGSNDLRKTKFNFEINRSLFLSFFKLVFHFCSVFFHRQSRQTFWLNCAQNIFFLFLFLLSTLTFKHTCTTNLHTNTYTPLLPSHIHTHIHKKFLHTWIKSRTRTHSHSLTPIHNSPLTLHMHTHTLLLWTFPHTLVGAHTRCIFVLSHFLSNTDTHCRVQSLTHTLLLFSVSLTHMCGYLGPPRNPPKSPPKKHSMFSRQGSHEPSTAKKLWPQTFLSI